jgi:DnaK suppressor protein
MKRTKGKAATLSAAQALLKRRRVLVREIEAGAATRRGERDANVPDSAELAADDVVRDVGIAEIDRDAAELAAIDAALERLGKGTYGSCIDCGAAIAAERLAHSPEAARCIACQELEERKSELRIARL